MDFRIYVQRSGTPFSVETIGESTKTDIDEHNKSCYGTMKGVSVFLGLTNFGFLILGVYMLITHNHTFVSSHIYVFSIISMSYISIISLAGSIFSAITAQIHTILSHPEENIKYITFVWLILIICPLAFIIYSVCLIVDVPNFLHFETISNIFFAIECGCHIISVLVGCVIHKNYYSVKRYS